MPPPSSNATATVSDFTRRVSDSVQRILTSTRQIVAASKVMDNDTADREGLEIVIHANSIVTGTEELLKLVSELKLAKLTMDWKTQDHHVTDQSKKQLVRETADRDQLKRIFDDVKQTLTDIDVHKTESRAKRINLSQPQEEEETEGSFQ